MRKILSILLIILMLAGAGFAVFSALYQPASEVLDLNSDSAVKASGNAQTTEAAGTPTNSPDGSGGSEPVAVLNPNVTAFTADDSSKINQAIVSVELAGNDCKIILNSGIPDSMKAIGTGDVFFLDGNSGTPMGEPFFGKVVSVEQRNGNTELICTTPAIDEVFDKLNMQTSEIIEDGDIQAIKTIPGVTATVGGSLDDISLAMNSPHAVPTSFGTAGTRGWHVEKLAGPQTMETKGASVVFEFEDVDIGKVFNLVSSATGHDPVFSESREKDVGIGGDSPEDDKTTLTMSGKIGLENIRVRSNIDCSLDYNTYIRNLSAGASADFASNIEIKYQLAGVKIHGAETEVKPTDWLKFQGLKKKAFPIAYFDVVTKRAVTLLSGNTQTGIETLTSVPVAFGVIVYSDIDGNLTIQATLKFSWRKEIDSGDFVLVRDGKYVGSEVSNDNLDRTNEFKWGLEASVQGDINATALGISVQIYICNLNIVDIGLVQLGVEAQGSASLKAGSDIDLVEAKAEGYMRGYLKLVNVRFGFKASVNLFFLKTGVNMSFEGTLFDFTLFQYGEKNKTSFDRGKMAYSQLVAKDGTYTFYKDLNGYLVRTDDDGGGRMTVSKDEFFMICGIDDSFVYVLKNADTAGVYNIERVSKDGGSSREIVSGVLWVLYMDDDYLYYVPDFNNLSISKVNRQTLDTGEFASFDDSVQLMKKQDGRDEYLISCGDSSGWFSSNTYWSLSLDGKQKTSLGGDLTTDAMWRYKKGESTFIEYPISNGYLRSTAKDEYVVPKNGAELVKTEFTTGWNPLEDGVFTTLNSQNGSGLPYEIVMYSAETGERVHVADVSSNYAFFTMCKDKYGRWYYFDQTDTDLVLHRMDNDFTNDKVIETIARNKTNYNLTDCSMVMFGDRIYFFTMPDNQTSKMLYRYNVAD